MKPNKPTSLATGFISLSLVVSSIVGGVPASRARAQSRTAATRRSEAAYPLLSLYAKDLTRLARLGRLQASADYEADITKVVEVLTRDAKNNPVLLAESVAGSAAVARGVAQRIAAGRVPARLNGASVYSLNRDALLAGAKTNEEFASRLRGVLAEASGARGKVVLFMEDLHQYVGSYTERSASDATRAAIETGQLHLIGATTKAIYDEHIAKDTGLAKLFQPLSLQADDKNSGSDKDDETATVEGDKLSPELREMVAGAKPGGKRVSVIMQADDLQNPQLEATLRRYGVKVDSRMIQFGALRVDVPLKALTELASNGATNYISPDRRMLTFGHVTATTGTDAVRNGGLVNGLPGTTLDGTGIGIAVLDSGIDVAHKAFGGRVRFKKDFTAENTTADKDAYGHGSHVASAAAGVSVTSGNTYEGVARNADIINLRVLDSTGTGRTSDLLAALNWILSPVDPNKAVSSANPTNASKYNIRVINMSLGAPAVDSYKNDPVCKAVRKLVDAGLVVVAAAGNNGKDSKGNKLYGQIHSPGDEPSAITVGAVNTFGTDARGDDGIATYSSRGPTRGYYTDAAGAKHYDNLIKPDLVAPGNKLIYAESDDKDKLNLLVTQHPELDSGIKDDDNRKLMYLSGTSMATPVVSGTVALMLQANPRLTPNMVKMILMYTSQQLAGFNTLEQGAGQLNVEGAIRLARLVRTDMSSSTQQGDPLLTMSILPDPKTSIAGYQFLWSQGVLLKQRYAMGTDLIAKYQTVYGTGMVLGDGIVMSDGILMSDGIVMSDGILMGDNILTSSGILMSDGTPFMACGILMSDGILMADGTFMGDGILMSDGILMADGILMSDAAMQAMSAAVNGDEGPGMTPRN
ncbi:MAG: serine protease AprX [Acidobacteriota bacterium]|jgi:subtilisin family serine protease|nr:serine protease AprX [Acidobacteriota bacterium]